MKLRRCSMGQIWAESCAVLCCPAQTLQFYYNSVHRRPPTGDGLPIVSSTALIIHISSNVAIVCSIASMYHDKLILCVYCHSRCITPVQSSIRILLWSLQITVQILFRMRFPQQAQINLVWKTWALFATLPPNSYDMMWVIEFSALTSGVSGRTVATHNTRFTLKNNRISEQRNENRVKLLVLLTDAIAIATVISCQFSDCERLLYTVLETVVCLRAIHRIASPISVPLKTKNLGNFPQCIQGRDCLPKNSQLRKGTTKLRKS